MPTTLNPFKPSYGTRPFYLAGRDELIEEFMDSLGEGPGAPGRTTIYTGHRGSGKTVILAELSERAQREGWVVLNTHNSAGLIDRLVHDCILPVIRKREGEITSITGVMGPGGSGLTWEKSKEGEPITFYAAMTKLLDLVEPTYGGVIVSIDEIHKKNRAALEVIAGDMQLFQREGRNVAFIAAGLPSAVSDIMNEDVMTFLRRAEAVSVGRISDVEVERAFVDTFENMGKNVGQREIETMTRAARGYAFLIQLIGHWTVKLSKDQDKITRNVVDLAIRKSVSKLGKLVHERELTDLSDMDKTFLLAMARDEGNSKLRDIMKRTNINKNYASVYRRRLMDANIITSPRHGELAFALPYLKEYLQDHSAPDALFNKED